MYKTNLEQLIAVKTPALLQEFPPMVVGVFPKGLEEHIQSVRARTLWHIVQLLHSLFL